MKSRTFIAAVATAGLAWQSSSADDAAAPFELTAEAAVLDVAPRPPGRTLLELPPLEYVFRLRTACTDGREPAAFSLNVADSRVTLDGAELAAGAPPRELRLTIPADQLAPLALTAFCVAPAADGNGAPAHGDGGDGGAAATELLVSDVLAAQASLLCETENDRKMSYLSKPLDLRLVCDEPELEASGTAINRD